MISKLQKRLLLIPILFLVNQTAQANLLSVTCDILNQGRFPQSSFMSGDTAIFRVHISLPNNYQSFNPKTEYRADLNVKAKATIKGFKIPFNLNESFNIPFKNTEGSLSEIKEVEVVLPDIRGKLTLSVDANISNSKDTKSSMVSCDKTLTIK